MREIVGPWNGFNLSADSPLLIFSLTGEATKGQKLYTLKKTEH